MKLCSLFALGMLALAVSCSKDTTTGGGSKPAAEIPTAADPEQRATESASDDVSPADSTTKPVTTGDNDSGFPPKLLTREQIEAGWISLFDGHSLFGWKANSDANWSVRDGVIQANTGDPGLLLTTIELADFELLCDFRLVKGGNSGIFLRTVSQPKNPAVDCYELNICDSHETFPTGSLVARKRIEKNVATEGEWKTYHVRMEGPRIEVQLDGKVVMVLTDDSEASQRIGQLGLQMNGGKIEFRNVFVRPLGMKAIFNGKNLDGWREVPGSKSKFEVVDGAIHVTDGPGFLETEAVWDDFVLRADVKINGKHLNSGIFFRAKPGTMKAPSHGYEMQIHNGFTDDDPTKPIDSGTGAIFRRAKARRVVASDNEWMTTTLIARGPHFATWVNGYQVVDWTDERPLDDNPRKGQRLKAGHFSLQGHDPTTNLDFKNFQIAPLPKSQAE